MTEQYDISLRVVQSSSIFKPYYVIITIQIEKSVGSVYARHSFGQNMWQWLSMINEPTLILSLFTKRLMEVSMQATIC